MGDEAVTLLSSAANGIIPTAALEEAVIEPQPSSSTSNINEEVTESQPTISVQDEEIEPQPRTRLFAESKPIDPFLTRPRSNASDYAKNPRSASSSIDLGRSEDGEENPLQNGVPAKLNLEVTGNLTKSSSLNGSSTSVDDVKVVVEDNDDVIMESPSVHQKEFSPEVSSELSSEFTAETGVPKEEYVLSGTGSGGSVGGSGGSVGSEPEPGASLEPVVRTSSGCDLLLVTPGNTLFEVNNEYLLLTDCCMSIVILQQVTCCVQT